MKQPHKSSPLDLSYLNQVTQGNSDLKRMLVETFLDQTPVMINDIEAGISSWNLDVISKMCHRAKSSIQAMGMKETSELLSKMEDKDELELLQQSGANNLINTVKSDCETAFAELRRVVNSIE